MEKQESILLEHSGEMKSKSFPKKVAEKALLKSEAQKRRGLNYWKLPDKSPLTLKAGHLVKAKA